MPHQELVIDGQRIPGVTEMLDTMDKKWLRPWYAKEELLRCIDELAEWQDRLKAETPSTPKDIRQMLAVWRKRVKEKAYAAEEKKNAAGDIGTEFHNWVEKYLKGEAHEIKPELLPKVQPLTVEFDRFHKEWKFNPTIGQELHVVSKRYVYQGTFDFLGETCKYTGLGLWDWKTSNKIDDTFGLQIALYAYAYGEGQGWTPSETWERITYGGSVRLDKKTGYLEHKVYKDLPYLFRVAISLREPYDYRNQVGAWEAEND